MRWLPAKCRALVLPFASARVQVNFNGPGSKWLVLAYAKLERL